MIAFNIIMRFAILLAYISYVTGDVFTALCKMERLAKLEIKMKIALEEYVLDLRNQMEFVPPELERFLTEVRFQAMNSNKEHFVENPINAFHVMYRMYNRWSRISNLILCDDCLQNQAAKKYADTMSRIKLDTHLNVTENDVIGTAMALIRLWYVYNLDTELLLRGHIMDTFTDPLTSADVLYITDIADEQNQHFAAIKWLEALLKTIQSTERNEDSTKEVQVVRRLASAYDKYGMPWKSLEILELYNEFDSSDKKVKENIVYFRGKLEKMSMSDRTKKLTYDESETREHYYRLCRGQVARPIQTVSELKCVYKKSIVPYYRVKEEIMNWKPRLSILYDVIFDDEANVLKKFAMSNLQRSGVILTENSQGFSEIRISETAWISDADIPMANKLSKRVEFITGLSTQQYPLVSHAEFFQIVNYGSGGMYEEHLDPFGYLMSYGRAFRPADPPDLQGSGDRIATWLYYLSDVKAGGATVFTNLNVTVPVVKVSIKFVLYFWNEDLNYM
ncbi:hypothetical protein CHS0354_032053 [Potamilus streckersoni]|uniref:Prolyl 4-hydroxylase alpha subunit domain-containing protein n=1 Tax=Potamilus streckersoni TaxID=2493646 RepID=A0AAE0TPJ6_9BIVA|nr:hypothetical protein CHS0354_032053 [Potamilus streckersoni]